MNYDAEILIRKHLTGIVETVAPSFVCIPAPIQFENRAAYFSNVSGLNLTMQKPLETTPVKFCAISILLPFEDENPIEDGCSDAPLTTITYNFYVFRQYEAMRENEADSFLTKTLKSYNEFIKTVLDLRTQFLGENEIGGISSDLIVTTNPVTPGDFIEEFEPSKYFRKENVFGHSTNLQLRINVLPIKD